MLCPCISNILKESSFGVVEVNCKRCGFRSKLYTKEFVRNAIEDFTEIEKLLDYDRIYIEEDLKIVLEKNCLKCDIEKEIGTLLDFGFRIADIDINDRVRIIAKKDLGYRPINKKSAIMVLKKNGTLFIGIRNLDKKPIRYKINIDSDLPFKIEGKIMNRYEDVGTLSLTKLYMLSGSNRYFLRVSIGTKSETFRVQNNLSIVKVI